MKLDLAFPIAHSRGLHRDRTDPGLNTSLWLVTVAHYAPACALVFQLPMLRDELRHFGFHRFLQQLPRPMSQYCGQRVGHRQTDSWIPIRNYAIFFHGVFSLAIRLMVLEKTHQEYATFFIPSSPTFDYNSSIASIALCVIPFTLLAR